MRRKRAAPLRPSCYCPAPPPCAEGHFCIRGDAAHRRRLAPRGKSKCARAKTRNNPVGAGSHPLPGVSLPPAPRRRSRPVGDGVLDDPFLRPPPAPRRRAEAAGGGAARKGGTPGEGSPFNPLLRFFSTRRVPRAAARVHGLRPWTPPAFL